MTQLSSFGDSDLDITAAAEQLAIVAALYFDRRAAVEQLLGAEGTVLVWEHQPVSWLPSWCLIRSGANRYYVCLAGTTNGWQGARHIDGSFGRVYVGQSNLLVNGQWLGAWEAIETDVIPQIPAGPGVTVYVSGHSYGGSVAHLGALSLQQRAVYGRVECLTIGQPKSLTVGYTGPAPAVYWRLTSWQDAVALLPLDNLVPGTDHWALPLVWRQAVADWVHYGGPAYIGMNGGIQNAGSNVDPPPPGVASTPVSEHLLPNYSARLRQNVERFDGTVAARQALDIADAVLTGGSLPVVPPGLPDIVPGPDGSPVRIPNAAPGVALTLAGAFAMPPTYPIDTAGRRMDVAFMFKTQGGAGWEESFLFVVQAGADPYAVAAGWAQAYAIVRRAVLSANVTLQTIRISDQEVKGDSERRSNGSWGTGVGMLVGNAGNPDDAWMWTLKDTTKIISANKYTRGYRDAETALIMANGNVLAPPAGKVQQYQQVARPLLTAPFDLGPIGSGRVCIRCLDRNPTNWIERRVTTVITTADCRSKLTISAAPGEFNVGDRIYLGVKRKRCARGISGWYDVIETEIVGGFPVLTVCRPICCGLGELLCSLPTVTTKPYIAVAVTQADITRGTDHDSGRPFGLSRGRRSASMC